MRVRTLRHVIYGFFVLLGGGLFYLQVLQGARFATQSEKNRIRLIPESAARGVIVDRNGIALVENVLTFDVVVLPQEMTKDRPEEVFVRLSPLVQIPSETLAERFATAPHGGFFPVLLAENVSRRVAFSVEQELLHLGGIMVQPRIVRRYPFGPATAHIAGYVGKMSERDLPEDRDRYGVPARDLIGRSGIEKASDQQLRGVPGGMQLEVNSKGSIMRVVSYRPPRGGTDVRLSIDVRLQEQMAQLFADRPGGAVVLDADSGEVWGLYSSPAYDPNLFISGESNALNRLFNDPRAPLLNRCVNAYAPGSIFKMVTAYAGLSEHFLTPATRYFCSGEFSIGDSLRRCGQGAGHGEVDLEEALAVSCNVYFWEVGLRVGDQSLAHAAHEFGFGSPHGIELPGEQAGVVPSSRWKMNALKQRWFGGDTVNVAIGQGYLLVTPLQAAVMAGMIANGGHAIQPTLLKSQTQRMPARQSLKAEFLPAIQRGMLEVVRSGHGTGQRAAVAGLSIYGKTGTAQVSGGAPHAWFVGYTRLGDRRVSFCVFLERGGSGADVPAEIARELILFLKTPQDA